MTKNEAAQTILPAKRKSTTAQKQIAANHLKQTRRAECKPKQRLQQGGSIRWFQPNEISHANHFGMRIPALT